MGEWCKGVRRLPSDAHASAAIIAHHGWVPRRVPDDLDFGLLDLFEGEQRVLHAPGDAFVHGAALRGERHLDGDLATLDSGAVDQAEIDDVGVNLRVHDLAQGFKDQGFVELRCVHKVVAIAGRKFSGSILGRMRWLRILMTFKANVPRLSASSAHPHLTARAFAKTIAMVVTTRPATYAQ